MVHFEIRINTVNDFSGVLITLIVNCVTVMSAEDDYGKLFNSLAREYVSNMFTRDLVTT